MGPNDQDDNNENLGEVELQGQQVPQQVAVQFPALRMVAESALMQAVVEQLYRAARIPFFPVLLIGETGVGKQEAAICLHRASHAIHRGPQKQFVEVDCGGLSANLLESELFGHVRGAFTGAVADKPGRLELADGGTLFLDEVGNATLGVQNKLLKFLDTGMVTAVGGTRQRQVKTRVVAATHYNLRRRVERRKFREDLFFRLNVFPINIPPLRDRPEDIARLVLNCIKRFNTTNQTQVVPHVSREVAEKLLQHTWPGNVRELFNVIERAIVMRTGVGQLEPSDIVFDSRPKVKRVLQIGGRHTLDQIEKAHIKGVLQSCGQNQTKAAKILGLNRDRIRYRLKKHGLLPMRTNVAEEEVYLEDDERMERDLIAQTLHECRWNMVEVAQRLRLTVEGLQAKITHYKIGPQ